MDNDIEKIGYQLINIIVNCGQGSKILKSAKESGVHGGTLLYGMGTASNRILDFLGFSDIKKEIVLILTDCITANLALENLNKEYKFYKNNHGIAYTKTISRIVGARNCNCQDSIKSEVDYMYNEITIVVDRGRAEYVIDAAIKAGSKGGTIINARGSGIHETSKLFSMNVEPEKEIIIILSEKDKTDAIVESIKNELNIEEPGAGIIFVNNVNKAYGLQ